MSAPGATNSPLPSVDGTLQLLDRQAPEEYLREWTERVAARENVRSPGNASAVLFRVGTEWLALPTRVFQEVAEGCILHTVPHRRGGVLAGLVNIRGELLLCALLSRLLGFEERPVQKNEANRIVYPRVLVANREGNRLAFPVDEVHAIVRYDPAQLNPLPATLAHAASAYTTGMLAWQDRTAGCLDDELLFYKLNRSFA